MTGCVDSEFVENERKWLIPGGFISWLIAPRPVIKIDETAGSYYPVA
jgi:hypothetical protein